ncbi:MAG: hypothetical protein CMJ44_03950 [Pimelobacter sp.]|nr:hypothetical protein [Pimelobacter sp.]
MPTLSLTSRTGRALGLRLYRDSLPEVHDHRRDRFIPTRQNAAEATQLMKDRLRVEIQRQEFRRATRKALYPVVVVLSLGVLAIPAAIQVYDSYQEQRNQRIFEEIQRENQTAPGATERQSQQQPQWQEDWQPSSGAIQPPTTSGPPSNPFGSAPFPETTTGGGGGFPQAPGADAARRAIQEGQ